LPLLGKVEIAKAPAVYPGHGEEFLGESRDSTNTVAFSVDADAGSDVGSVRLRI
jgi:hypothetical protein